MARPRPAQYEKGQRLLRRQMLRLLGRLQGLPRLQKVINKQKGQDKILTFFVVYAYLSASIIISNVSFSPPAFVPSPFMT